SVIGIDGCHDARVLSAPESVTHHSRGYLRSVTMTPFLGPEDEAHFSFITRLRRDKVCVPNVLFSRRYGYRPCFYAPIIVRNETSETLFRFRELQRPVHVPPRLRIAV